MPTVYSHLATCIDGYSPCVIDGLLSNATCKRVLRYKAKPGDMVLIYASKKLNNERQLLCMYSVDASLPVLEYHNTLYHGQFWRRPDQLYNLQGQQQFDTQVRHACRANRLHDLFRTNHSQTIDQRVLLSRRFRFYVNADQYSRRVDGVPLATMAGLDTRVKLLPQQNRGYKKTHLTQHEFNTLATQLETAARPYERPFHRSVMRNIYSPQFR
jgi:hypothetical protein